MSASGARQRAGGAMQRLVDPWVGFGCVLALAAAESLRLTLFLRSEVIHDAVVSYEPAWVFVNVEPFVWVLPGWMVLGVLLRPAVGRGHRGADAWWAALGVAGSVLAPFVVATLATCVAGDARIAEATWIVACFVTPVLGGLLVRHGCGARWRGVLYALLPILAAGAAFNLLVHLGSLATSHCPSFGWIV